MSNQSNNGKQEYYEFYKTYDFKVEMSPSNVIGEPVNEIIEGEINFYSDIDWDPESGVYNVSYSWDESTGSFDNEISSPPDKEDEFFDDLKKYLLSQGVSSSELDW